MLVVVLLNSKKKKKKVNQANNITQGESTQQQRWNKNLKFNSSKGIKHYNTKHQPF